MHSVAFLDLVLRDSVGPVPDPSQQLDIVLRNSFGCVIVRNPCSLICHTQQL